MTKRPSSTRRGFFGWALAAAAGAAALALGIGRRRPTAVAGAATGPRERDLREADLLGPHDLAG